MSSRATRSAPAAEATGPLVGIAVEDSSGNTLGGPTASAGNTISGNYYAGIYVFGQGTSGTPGNVIVRTTSIDNALRHPAL